MFWTMILPASRAAAVAIPRDQVVKKQNRIVTLGVKERKN